MMSYFQQLPLALLFFIVLAEQSQAEQYDLEMQVFGPKNSAAISAEGDWISVSDTARRTSQRMMRSEGQSEALLEAGATAAEAHSQEQSPVDLFDCRAGYAHWQAGWSEAKKKWCCANKKLGCPVKNVPFDCNEAYANWQASWSDSKKVWCCKNMQKGCPEGLTSSINISDVNDISKLINDLPSEPCNTTANTSMVTPPPTYADCRLSDWSTWSSCTKTCGPSEKMRLRAVVQKAIGGGKECTDGTTDVEQCGLPECGAGAGTGTISLPDGRVVTVPASPGRPGSVMNASGIGSTVVPEACSWADWRSWSDCQSCGAGYKMRLRLLKAATGAVLEALTAQEKELAAFTKQLPKNFTGAALVSALDIVPPSFVLKLQSIIGNFSECAASGAPVEIAACTGKDCCSEPGVVNGCMWTEWQDWGECSRSCAGGQMRSRRDRHACDGSTKSHCVGEQYLTESCNIEPCPVDCKWSTWESWSACSKSCGSGNMERSRAKAVEADFGGAECPDTQALQQVACNRNPCPVDCLLDTWTEWSVCSKTCGTGQMARTRGLATPAANGGQFCVGERNESKECNAFACPVDCTWQDWEPWSTCSVTCGGSGTKSRIRGPNPSFGNGAACVGQFSETAPCEDLKLCPEGCIWAEWTVWSGCSVTCGTGSMNRERTIKKEAKFGGPVCEGDSRENKECSLFLCPADCVWSPWAAWSYCPPDACAPGNNTKSTRNRSMQTPAVNGGSCDGKSVDSKDCCSSECEWETWTEWSACSVSCGIGKKVRTRSLATASSKLGQTCTGGEGINILTSSCQNSDPKACKETTTPPDRGGLSIPTSTLPDTTTTTTPCNTATTTTTDRTEPEPAPCASAETAPVPTRYRREETAPPPAIEQTKPTTPTMNVLPGIPMPKEPVLFDPPFASVNPVAFSSVAEHASTANVELARGSVDAAQMAENTLVGDIFVTLPKPASMLATSAKVTDEMENAIANVAGVPSNCVAAALDTTHSGDDKSMFASYTLDVQCANAHAKGKQCLSDTTLSQTLTQLSMDVVSTEVAQILEKSGYPGAAATGLSAAPAYTAKTRFFPTKPEQARGRSMPQDCSASIPGGASLLSDDGRASDADVAPHVQRSAWGVHTEWGVLADTTD